APHAPACSRSPELCHAQPLQPGPPPEGRDRTAWAFVSIPKRSSLFIMSKNGNRAKDPDPSLIGSGAACPQRAVMLSVVATTKRRARMDFEITRRERRRARTSRRSCSAFLQRNGHRCTLEIQYSCPEHRFPSSDRAPCRNPLCAE